MICYDVSMDHTKTHNKGFTLIELMVVIGVMGALIAIVAGNFVSAQVKARDARRKNDLAQVGKAVELYYNDHGRYPLSSGNGTVSGCGSDSEQPCAWGSSFEDEHGTLYMDTLPRERTNGMSYVYVSDGIAYQLFARLENLNDPTLDRTGDGVADEYSVSCGGGACNFAITSPNTNGSESI